MKKWGIALILFVLHIIIILIGIPYPSAYLLVALLISTIGFSIYSLIKKEKKTVPIIILSLILLEVISTQIFQRI